MQGIANRVMAVIILVMFLSPQSLADSGEALVLTLEECIDRAIRNNPDLKSIHLEVEGSEERIREERAAYYPWLDISASAGYYDGSSFSRSGGTGYRKEYSTGIHAGYTLFDGFRRKASNDAAHADYRAWREQYNQERDNLIGEVTEAYYRLLQTRRMVEVAEKSLKRSDIHLDFARARFRNGLASRADVLKARVERSNAELAMIRARNNRLAAAGHLNVLLGRPAQRRISIYDDLEIGMSDLSLDSSMVRVEAEQLIQAAFQSRPEMISLSERIDSQRAAVTLARSDYFPTVSLDGSYSLTGEDPSDMKGSTYLGLSMSLPLFRGFARPAVTGQAYLSLNNLQNQLESLRNRISLEVWEAYLSVKEAHQRNLSSEIYYRDARENLRIAEGEYREGVGSMLDVIDAETALVTAEESYIDALVDFRIAMAELKRSVGRKDIGVIIQ